MVAYSERPGPLVIGGFVLVWLLLSGLALINHGSRPCWR